MYNKGRGAVLDLGQASHWYLKAAEQEYTKTQTNRRSRRLSQGYSKGMGWYLKAAEKGIATAQGNVA